MSTTWRRKYERVAKLEGMCPICDAPILVGQHIAYAPQRQVEHWTCFLLGSADRRDREPGGFVPLKERQQTRPASRGMTLRAQHDLDLLRRLREDREAIATE